MASAAETPGDAAVHRKPTGARKNGKAHLYAFSSAAAHAANLSTATVQHRQYRAQVKLYLDRWRREFAIAETGPTHWAAWLLRPQPKANRREIAATIGKLPQAPKAIEWAFSALVAVTARGS